MHTMNNSELFVAIEATFNMLQKDNKYSDSWHPLIEHLKQLLTLQRQRAELVEIKQTL